MAELPTNGTIPYTGSIETFTVQETGTYDIIAYGAAGGAYGGGGAGGLGAEIGGDIALTANETLEIVVGQAGSYGNGGGAGGGGGGGTFVIELKNAAGTTVDTPLVVAGGGGGGYGSDGSGANVGTFGYTGGGGALGGTNGGGGAEGGGSGGGGGGGFRASGGSNPGGSGGGGGFSTGFAGGNNQGGGGAGGFGGGGAGGGGGGGGGGGYSGGGGGGGSSSGGGGGSYFQGTPTIATDAATSDGNGLVEINEVSCFLEGTSIATPDGERRVETLRIGDLVTTTDGCAERVRWIGRRTLHAYGAGGYRFADPQLYMPIRIRAGALGENLPLRDLLLSADHAVLVDGLLVQAGALVNGLSVLRQTRLPETFTFYHIELAQHALVLAEGVPAETFVDNVCRMGFDNWAEHEALYGNEPSIVEMDYPRVQSLRQLPLEIRRLMRDRARTMTAATTEGVAA
jgi:Hint domain